MISSTCILSGVLLLATAWLFDVGGLVEIVFGVKAERQSLEDIAVPLTADNETAPGDDQHGITGP